jgi:hypothetical protein
LVLGDLALDDLMIELAAFGDQPFCKCVVPFCDGAFASVWGFVYFLRAGLL